MSVRWEKKWGAREKAGARYFWISRWNDLFDASCLLSFVVFQQWKRSPAHHPKTRKDCAQVGYQEGLPSVSCTSLTEWFYVTKAAATMNVISSASGRRSSTGGIAKATTTTTMTPSKSKLVDYEERLNFYTESPHVELSIDDFEVLALKRLKVGARSQCFASWKTFRRPTRVMQCLLSTHPFGLFPLLPIGFEKDWTTQNDAGSPRKVQ